MLKFLQTPRMNDFRLPSLVLGLVAMTALMSATPVAPAFAQGVPAGLLRLDLPQPSNDGARIAEDHRAKVRGAYARSRKIQTH